METEIAQPALVGLIAAGAILVKAETRLPATLTAAQPVCMQGWNFLREWPSAGFQHTLKDAGWKFFAIGIPMSVTASGRTVEPVFRKLLDRIIRTVDRRDCNCFEIMEVTVSRALFFTSVRLDAQARHIQKGSQGDVARGVQPE